MNQPLANTLDTTRCATPIASSNAPTERALNDRNRAFNHANKLSIGLKSGL